MKPRRRRLAQRPDLILDAADDVLRGGGARALTMDAVAAAAGISKGGVLHHYASKEALISALVARELMRLRGEIAEHARATGSVRSALLAQVRGSSCDQDAYSRALLLASFEQPQALTGYREFVTRTLADLRAGGPPGAGMAVFFALLGLVMGRALGFHDLSQGEIDPLLKALGQLADVSAEEGGAAEPRARGAARSKAPAAADGRWLDAAAERPPRSGVSPRPRRVQVR